MKSSQYQNPEEIRATYARINMSRLRKNLEIVKSRVQPAKVMIIVKANAYGNGMGEVALELAEMVDYLGVAVLEEGIYLRKLGVHTPILVMGGIWGEQVPLYLQYDLTYTASSVERLQQIDSVAKDLGKKALVHIKIDTGMERIGVHYYNAETIQQAALRCNNIVVEGIFTHFANSDSLDLTSARLQIERFEDVLDFYPRNCLPMPIRHMANSGGILQLPESYYDMVRPGILLYGVYPNFEIPRAINVRPVLSWISRVVYFKIVKDGHPISYGWTWQPDHPVRIITLPVGYGDGYFRSMSNRAEVILNGKRFPQVGRICMDQMMVNIEDESAFNGDEVILIGESGTESITAEELSQWAGTIPYEILTNINTRVPRVYYYEDDRI